MKIFKSIQLILFLSVIGVFTSCRSVRQEVKNQDTKTELITEKKVSYQDTILYTPSSTSALKVPISSILEKDFKGDLKDIEKPFKPRTFSQKNGNATAKIKIERDTILIYAECDSIALQAKIKKEFESKYQHHSTVKVEEKKEKKTNYLDTIFYCIAGIGVGFIAGFITGKIIKI